MTLIDPVDVQVIRNLILRYAELVDDGDFGGVAELLADATYRGSGAPLHGRAEIEQWFRETLIVYPDGTPRTQHLTTNVAIEADGKDAASARSYVTVLQAVPGDVPRIIAAGRYRDRFERRDGSWRWTERNVNIRLVGDVSKHLRS
ncbi:nuclear transport factor 2 family protein [Kribbella jejuensis]|uniref:3-phenylpropionate/cinnamic acid dioxygenase small subunit n=1 Tax=Kribbella jejuensis TaxID=236068 RepID=A0A542ESU2_9ACTN|nr:nuclear transport factor 2 family protein [Kribbella jejuensis]TQJ18437.1 3-phenylpropionate/cinnamic acid dioxygenase small subunit [Kribbella jejuensis]